MNSQENSFNTDQEQMSLDDFVIQNKVGYGSFGKVYKIRAKKSREIYAAKISHNEIVESSPEMKLDISREVSILSQLNHPSVLKFIYFSPTNFKKKPKPVIITEYASNGTLEDFINEKKQFEDSNLNDDKKIKKPEEENEPNKISNTNTESPSNIKPKKVTEKDSNLNTETPSDIKIKGFRFDGTRKLIIVYGIASAMSYLHKHDIIHRDLKPTNILMDDFLFPKIADFGLAKVNTIEKVDFLLKSTQGSIKGTPIYMAPEIWQRLEYSKASDVYAFGLILYELFTQTKPFDGCNVFQIPMMLLKKYRPLFNKEIPHIIKNLITRCWSEDPKQRPTFDQIIDELKNNKEYITSDVNRKEYSIYVNYIEEQQSSFEISKNIDLDTIFGRIKIDQQESFNKRKSLLLFFPYEMFIQLKQSESINLVFEARSDPEKLFRLAQCVIEGESDFPRNVQLGIKYLRQLINISNKEAVIYYIRILLKGDIVPFNENHLNKLLEKFLIDDKSIYYFFQGKLNKKKKNYEQAESFFISSIAEKNFESIYEYCKMYFKRQTSCQNEELIINLLKKLIIDNFIRASYKYGKYLINRNQENDYINGLQFILNAANRGHIKSCYMIGNVLYDDNKLDDCFPYLEYASNKGHKKAHMLLAKFKKYNEKMSLYKKAADKGDIGAIYNYGYLLKDRQESARYVKIAADNGCTIAMTSYGKMLRLGDGVPADSNEAVKYYKMAIEKGNVYGMTCYAHMLKYGDGIPANPSEAAKYYKMAIEKGDTTAMNDYGHMLKNGIGVEKNYEEAIKYYKMAIEKGDPAAMNNYGFMLYTGTGVEKNYEEAIKYFKMSIEGGYPEAMHTYADMLIKGIGVEKNIQEAIKYLKMAIDNGLAKSMNTYALLLKQGNGVSVNYHEAAKYYKMAIEKGNVAAMYNYAKMLEKGNGLSINYIEAIKYYKMAVENGYPLAMNDLGMMYLTGIGVEVNYDEAAKYFKMAIKNGVVESMVLYAKMLEKGAGCQPNIEEAIKYYKLAISKGNAEAMYQYAILLYNGNGVKQDIDEAKKFFQLSCEHRCGNNNK